MLVPKTMLDLLLVTFNCGKDFIEPKSFAAALQHGLGQGAPRTQLPDLVVFSLQEVSPISYAYCGGATLEPYLSKFDEALNLAATYVVSASASTGDGVENDVVGVPPPQPVRAEDFEDVEVPQSSPYTLVRSKNVGMTAVLLFAKDPKQLGKVQEAETGFGVMDMGNKGAVALRTTYFDTQERFTELTFVAAHLRHGEAHVSDRNNNWNTMMAELTFADPKKVLEDLDFEKPTIAALQEQENSDDDELEPDSDRTPLLGPPACTSPHHAGLREKHLVQLHDLSMFKPSSHLFVAGDLNYRISDKEPKECPKPIVFPSFDVPTEDPRHWSHFLSRDQLTIERAAQRTCHGLDEHPIRFGPSYKYKHLRDDEDISHAENANAAREKHEIAWKWASNRWPSWCDRILFFRPGGWVRRRETQGRPTDLQVKAYDIMPLLATSDHRPVFLRVGVPILTPAEMIPPRTEEGVSPEGAEAGQDVLIGAEVTDPRVRLPVPINVFAWEKRATARRREWIFGWTGRVWSTAEGAVVLVSSVAIVFATWYLYRAWHEAR